MASELRRNGGSGLDFKGDTGNLQVHEKEQTLGKEMLAGSPRKG